MALRITKIKIHHFRSITDLTIELPSNHFPTMICGANNVGKTNVLRALNLFFYETFNAEDDIPYNIVEGSRGQGYKTKIDLTFFDEAVLTSYTITKQFTRKIVGSESSNQINVSGKQKKGNTKGALTPKEIDKFLKSIWFIFIEASNINLPHIVSEIVKNDILAIGLDSLRKRQKQALESMQEFIKDAKTALGDIEKEIGKEFNDFISNNSSIKGVKDWDIEMSFPEFENLRQAISEMVNLTLVDTNKRRLDSKGSGIQRILLLSLIKYISNNSKKNVIWGLDEPEAFLQAGLQKEVFKILKEESNSAPIMFTTHSHLFIDINQPDNIIFLGADYETKQYKRRPGEKFYKANTRLLSEVGAKKIVSIKEQLGMKRNDGWEVMPYNVLVEGQEDLNYLTHLLALNDIQSPNFFNAGGVTKFRAYLDFVDDYCRDLNYKPIFVCVFDHDTQGKSDIDSLKARHFRNITTKCIFIPRYDGLKSSTFDYEFEDFVFPGELVAAANQVLTLKGYQEIDADVFLRNRSEAASDKICILQLLSEASRASNPTKPTIEFDSLDIKLLISSNFVRRVNRTVNSILISQFPIIKTFLENLSTGAF